MTPKQCRRARALLAWSQDRLGRAVGLYAAAVSLFEREGRLPNHGEGFPDWRDELRVVLEQAGVIFSDESDRDLGVRLRRGNSGP